MKRSESLIVGIANLAFLSLRARARTFAVVGCDAPVLVLAVP